MPQHQENQLISSSSKAVHLLAFTSNCENTCLNKILRQNFDEVLYLKGWNRPLLDPKVTTIILVEVTRGRVYAATANKRF
jgi:hypothetical protein